MNASTRLKSRFDGFQPIELKASTKLRLSHDSIFEVAVASIVEAFSASTVTLSRRSRRRSCTYAFALESITFVTTTAPLPVHALVTLSSNAVRSASSFAETVTSPVVVTGAFSRCASTELRRSLWSTSRK